MTGVQRGTDGLPRCPWALSDPDYVTYHDDEWGRRVYDDNALFERLSLESFQAGLSWLVILRKRPALRAAFAGFDPVVLADFDDDDVDRLMCDDRIVRNRAKIAATINNARAVLQLDSRLGEFLWSFAPTAVRAVPVSMDDVPSMTPESIAMANALKDNNFQFVGPTTSYALMQATGMVNDHLAGCVARARIG